MAQWFRSWHGAPTDPKWLLIARNSGSTPIIVSALFWALCDHASQADDRGSVAEFDQETYAAWSGVPDDEIAAVIAALTEKGIIVEGRLAAWEKRQPKRDDDSRERVRAHRQRVTAARTPDVTPLATDETHCNAPVTQRNAGETQGNAPDTDTETEQKQNRVDIAGSPPAETPAALVDAYCQIRGQPFPEDAGPFINISKGLIRRGYTSADVEGCTRYMLSDDYWRAHGRMTFKSLAGNLPDWVQNGRPERAASDRASPTDAAWQAIDDWTPDEEQVTHAK